MPGLFLVPLGLLALPYKRQPPAVQLGWNPWIFSALAIPAIGLAFPISQLSDAEILNHPQGTTLGLPAWRLPTMILLQATLIGIAAIWTRLLASPALWRSLAWRSIAGGLVLIGLGFLTVWAALDWQQGFRGPPLHYNLLRQSMAAPGKPLVAHLLNFGPVFLLALVYCIDPHRFVRNSQSFALLAIVSAALPLYALGSESRQWIPFFPLLVALVALNVQGTKTLAWLTAYGLLFTLVIFLLRPEGDVQSTGSMLWTYLIYQGPWMPHWTYVPLLLATLALLLIPYWTSMLRFISKIKINLRQML